MLLLYTNIVPNSRQNFFEVQSADEFLPIFAIVIFSRDPLQFPERNERFESTFCKRSVSSDQHVRYLNRFTSGKAKATIIE